MGRLLLGFVCFCCNTAAMSLDAFEKISISTPDMKMQSFNIFIFTYLLIYLLLFAPIPFSFLSSVPCPKRGIMLMRCNECCCSILGCSTPTVPELMAIQKSVSWSYILKMYKKHEVFSI